MFRCQALHERVATRALGNRLLNPLRLELGVRRRCSRGLCSWFRGSLRLCLQSTYRGREEARSRRREEVCEDRSWVEEKPQVCGVPETPRETCHCRGGRKERRKQWPGLDQVVHREEKRDPCGRDSKLSCHWASGRIGEGRPILKMKLSHILVLAGVHDPEFLFPARVMLS